MACGESAAWPPVRMKRMGWPLASVTIWILVLSPPLERPTAWSWGPPLSAHRLLVGPDDRRVDHDVCVVGVCQQRQKDPLPDPGPGPAREPLVCALFAHASRLAVSVLGRQVFSVSPAAQHPQNAVHEGAVVLCGHPDRSGPPRQEPFDPAPLGSAQLVPLHVSLCSLVWLTR